MIVLADKYSKEISTLINKNYSEIDDYIHDYHPCLDRFERDDICDHIRDMHYKFAENILDLVYKFIEEEKSSQNPSEEEKISYEELEADRDDYKKRFKQMVYLTNKLKNAFLGENYYISCSCGEPQASEIIIDEIIDKFAPKPKKPNKNWIFNRFG